MQQRTLGVITKTDLLDEDSGSEAKFLELARNEDVFFSLGWHVVKNRKFKEKDFSIQERNLSEQTYFSTSNFRTLPKENVGIDALRLRLSQLLFEHVKNELPRLHNDLESALKTAQHELTLLGGSRSTVAECRNFMAQLNMKCYELCKAGVSGHYEDIWFQKRKVIFPGIPIQRLRAIIQKANKDFEFGFRQTGHKYQFALTEADDTVKSRKSTVQSRKPTAQSRKPTVQSQQALSPITLSKEAALAWVDDVLQQSRGTELLGTFNPNLIAELFWEQSERWEEKSKRHIALLGKTCEEFLTALLNASAPQKAKPQIW